MDSHKLRHTVGDASAEGFAIGTQYLDLHLEERDGLWLDVFAEGSSNLSKAQNHVNHLLLEAKVGKHDVCEV